MSEQTRNLSNLSVIILIAITNKKSNEQVTGFFLITKNVYSAFHFKSPACFVWLESAGRSETGLFKGA